ncbi:MAG TPA: polyprenyl synthetase family protein [Polyangiales bacterium]
MIPAVEREVLSEAASKDPSAASAAQHLDAVSRLLSDTLPSLERTVLGAADGPAPLDQASAHLLAAGGKRVRPTSCLLMTAACGGDPRKAVPIAAAAELIHSATLLHDDVIDEGEERRNRPASRVLWGNLVSVLSGDLLLIRALSMVESAGVPGAMEDLLSTLDRLIGGEVAQLHARDRDDLGRAGYLAIVGGKTASLFGFACRSGARQARRDELIEPAGRFGEQVGVAFQVIDDVLDLAGDPREVGKRLGADLAEGKTTLPLAIALERDESGELAQLLPRARRGDADAARAVSNHRLVRVGCDEARAFAAERSRDALDALDQLPNTRARELLRNLALVLTRRKT